MRLSHLDAKKITKGSFTLKNRTINIFFIWEGNKMPVIYYNIDEQKSLEKKRINL